MHSRTAVREQLRQLGTWMPNVGRGDAPWLYTLDDYKRWFPRTGRIFLRYLKRSGMLKVQYQQERGGVVGVVIVPWVSTPNPWYAVMIAIGLARRGRRVVLLWDDTGFVEDHLDEQNQVIAKVLRYVSRAIPVVRLSDESPSPTRSADSTLVSDLTTQNLTWRFRGAAQTDREQPLADQVTASLSRSLPFIRSALDHLELDCLVVSGGVYGTSGLFRREAEARGCRVATFDADRGISQICVDGVAAQSGDIPRAFDVLWASDEETVDAAIEVARAEFQLRTQSSDGYGFQPLAAHGSDCGDSDSVLIPLNVEWDTAALGKHVLFANTVDWLTTTVTAILERDAGPVIVRQHPSERRAGQRSKLDIRSLLTERFGGDERVRFVAAEDAVNSYDLLRSARLVLPFVSTIAIEAAGMGKPVLISGASYYARLGFVWCAGSRDEYLELLDRGLRGELESLPDQSQRAWICYYLTAVRNRVPTDFTPQPEDFWRWRRRDPKELFADPEVSDILAAIDSDEPVSLLRHRRISTMRTK
jgi:Capsule polysaccharide biosynthesis protein